MNTMLFDVQLDYHLIVERIQRHKEGYDVATGKDIVFFIGNTGAGKTTTILYLSGKEIREELVSIKVGDEEVEDFMLLCADAMPGFVIGHKDVSETVAANSFNCPESGLTFVDFAGQLDTQGHEIEIANTVGLYNTLSRASSVRLVLVTDYQSVGTLRGQIIKKSIEFVSGFVPNLQSKFHSVTVLFTHDAKLGRLKVELGKLKSSGALGEVSDFLDHLINFVSHHGENLLVEPTNIDKRGRTVEVIRSSAPMVTGPDSYRFFLPNESRTLFVEKLKGVLAVVHEYLCSYSWIKAKELMDDLHLLYTEISMMREIVGIYEHAMRMAAEAVQGLVADTQKVLEAGDYQVANNYLTHLTGAHKIHDHIKLIDIKSSISVIREVINSRVASIEKEIYVAESYALVRQKLDLLKSITLHLHPHLSNEKKELAVKLEQYIQEQVQRQYTDIMSLIDSFNRNGSYYVEEKSKNLTELLAYNLTLMVEVDKFSEGCAHYQTTTGALNEVLALHSTKFMSEVLKEQVSTELQLSFKVLKDFIRTPSLAAHASDDARCLYNKACGVLVHQLEELNSTIGMHTVSYSFAPVSNIITRIHALANTDREVFGKFESEKLAQTVTQMQTLVTNMITEVKKKVDEALTLRSTVDGCKFIRSKVETLGQATKVESEFSDPTLVSSFLTDIRDCFLSKAHQDLNVLDEALLTGNFGVSQQGREIYILLEVGIIPEAVQQFQVWIAKFQDKVRAVELQVKSHIDIAAYPELVADIQLLESIHQFDSSFVPSGLEAFSIIASSISTMINNIVEKIRSDWKEYHRQFFEKIKALGPQITTADLEGLRKDLPGLIRKLKDINDTNLEQHLRPLKPSLEFAAVVVALKSSLHTAESDTRTLISVGQLESAEKNLPIVDLLCNVLSYVSTVEGMPSSSLSSSLREKRLNMTQQIPEKLKRKSFSQVAKILENMRSASGDAERKEFENACEIVEDYFADLLNAARTITVESIPAAIETLETFDKAIIIDEVVPDLKIAAARAKFAAKVKTCIDKNVKLFKQLLIEGKHLEARALMVTMTTFGEQYAEEFKDVDLQGEIVKHVQDIHKTVASILDNNKLSNLHKIDKFIEQLDGIRDQLGVDVDDDIVAIEKLVITAAAKKVSTVRTLISEFNIEKARVELHYLRLLVPLKCLTTSTEKDEVPNLQKDIESIRSSQFSWDMLQRHPKKLTENLATVRLHSHAQYIEKLENIEKLCTEQSKIIIGKLDNITCSSSSMVLKNLAKNIDCYQSIVQAFSAQHETFAAKLQSTLDNTILGKLHTLCISFQDKLENDIKARQFENADKILKLMESIKQNFASYVLEEFVKIISSKNMEIDSIASAMGESTKYLKSINLWEPINIDGITTNLAKLKDNAPSRSHLGSGSTASLESYEDVIKWFLNEAEQKGKAAVKLWEEGKYEYIVYFIENLQQGTKFVNHAALVTGLTEQLASLTTFITNHISQLEKEADKAYKEGKLDQVESIHKLYSTIHKYFCVFHRIFPSGKNKITEALMIDASLQREKFCTVYSGTPPSVGEAITVLLSLKKLSSEISNTDVQALVHAEMNNLLSFLLSNKKFDFFIFGNELSEKPLGKEIVEGDNFPQFKAVAISLINKSMVTMSLDDALKKLAMRNKWTDTKHLQTVFQRFHSIYNEKFLPKYLMASDADMDALVKNTCAQFDLKDWKATKEALPDALAAIFTVWSVSTCKAFYQDTKRMDTVLRPHPYQVLTILCMLGLDTPDETKSWWAQLRDCVLGHKVKDKIKGHLVQIGTGEGKSVVLAVLSIVLSLLGFEVSCGCYSSYLSERDYSSFLHLFSRFGVDTHIHYSTLAQLAGSYINEQGDIRHLTNQFIEGDDAFSCTMSTTAGRPRVLLIDEVDTFLSRDFYGATYNPCTILHNKNVNLILEYIWKHQDCTLATIKELNEFKALIAQYKDISKVITGSVQRMIFEVKNVKNPPYFCVKNKSGHMVIAYKENGALSTNIQHGYRTCFAYLQERDRGHVLNQIAQQHLGLTINCGQFSYAEIPKDYDCILGVTGTLETLCTFEKEVKEKTYLIEKETFTPSIYGDSRRTVTLSVKSDTANCYLQLVDTIKNKQKDMQPVLVFFESEHQMDTFAASDYCKGLNFNRIREDTENIDFYIRKATRINDANDLPEVTFLTRVFGRGLDFVCRDDRVNKVQGIHVIQAFLSEDVSEEIQIKGRTARQGKPGTYSLILNAEDLDTQFSIAVEDIERHKKNNSLYEFLHATRVTQFERKSKDRQQIINSSYQVHKESIEFREQFKSKRSAVSSFIVNFLEKQNPMMKSKSKTICLSDATGSMSKVWGSAKSQVVEMVKRIINIGGEGKSELKWVAYRDYSDKVPLESSVWSNDPAVLHDFIEKIECTGGGDYPEAVELGLQEANNNVGVTRVILIADAPPHFESKGTMLKSHNVVMATDYKEQAALLAKKGIPVYCFYMGEDDDLVTSFKEIATTTGGKAALFIDANTLIDIVAENVLADIGGDEMVKEYRKTYHS